MISNNPNIKGALGEAAVCKDLLRLGYSIFLEFGSHSKIDLIALDEILIALRSKSKQLTQRINASALILSKIV